MRGISSDCQASAPGSLMLLGEYAVLEGAIALMMTLPYRLTVSLQSSLQFQVFSDRFGHHHDDRLMQEGLPPHVLLIACIIKNFQNAYGLKEDLNFRITIQSNIHPTLGFGSSAALNAALLKALSLYYQQPMDHQKLFQIGLKSIHEIYTRGSGADLVAALYDQPLAVVDVTQGIAYAMALPFLVSALYVGYKTPTPQVLTMIQDTIDRADWDRIIKNMKSTIETFLSTQDIALIQEYQKHLEALGVCCVRTKQALDLVLLGSDRVAKISGSGLGDCIVIFSATPFAIPRKSLPPGFIFFDARSLTR